jgi:hypothetical protein
VAVGGGRYLEMLGLLGAALSSALGGSDRREDRISIEHDVLEEHVDQPPSNP